VIANDPRIPEPLREIFRELRSAVVWLHGHWIIYRQLYSKSSERVELLNESAGTFFSLLQNILMHDTVLAIARLTDRSEIRGRENLVLRQLVEKLDSSSYPDLMERLKVCLGAIDIKCEVFRTKRNRQVAHSDLMAALKVESDPLPGISRAMVEDALKAIREYMNEFENYFSNSTMAYECFSMQSDGEALIWQLKRAADYRDGVADGSIARDRMLESRYRTA
jgi:AbiU2